jgi:hypothetical protein
MRVQKLNLASGYEAATLEGRAFVVVASSPPPEHQRCCRRLSSPSSLMQCAQCKRAQNK